MHIIQKNYNYKHFKNLQTHYSSIVLLGIEFDETNGDVEGVDVQTNMIDAWKMEDVEVNNCVSTSPIIDGVKGRCTHVLPHLALDYHKL